MRVCFPHLPPDPFHQVRIQRDGGHEERLHQEPDRAGILTWDFQPPEHREISVCRASPAAYAILLPQPELPNTKGKGFRQTPAVSWGVHASMNRTESTPRSPMPDAGPTGVSVPREVHSPRAWQYYQHENTRSLSALLL